MLPLSAGVAPFGIIFGVLSLAAGLPWWAPVAMSGLVFAGSAQFVAILLLQAGTAYPFIVLTTMVLNLRHALYGASIAEFLRPLSEWWRGLLAFGMTDESYAIAIAHYRNHEQGDGKNKHWYFLGASVGLFVVWVGSSAAGYFAGNAFGDPMVLGLDFALPVVFIAILVPQLRTGAGVVAAVVAGATAVLTLALPNMLGLIVAISAGMMIGLVLELWNSRS
jgi:4-azaleucine resistance transporter AzlC